MSFLDVLAPAKDLDSCQHVCRSQAHTELLVKELELGTLWDAYRLVGDIVVSVCQLYLSTSNIIF